MCDRFVERKTPDAQRAEDALGDAPAIAVAGNPAIEWVSFNQCRPHCELYPDRDTFAGWGLSLARIWPVS